MNRGLAGAVIIAATCLLSSGVFAQSGAINKAVGGYTWEDAAKEAPTTKKDGKPLTFAIITHTAGNGFFDPVYVGAKPVGTIEFGLTESERPGKKLLDVLKSIGTELGRIVERKSTQHAFEISHQQNRAFFENASFGAAQAEPGGKFLRVNDAMCRITGYSRDELMHMQFSDYTHPEDRAVD